MEQLHKILIVDDDRFNIKVLTHFLRDHYKIMAAKDGEAAIEAVLSSNPPDLILLDIMLPGIDGYEVCKKIKEHEKVKDIPIIFVTAISEAMDAAKGFECGAVDYISKPFNPVTVMARVKTHIQLSCALRDLKEALEKVKELRGLLPICSYCKQIRDDKGYWNQIEAYIAARAEVDFSHSICPDCAKKYYPDFSLFDD